MNTKKIDPNNTKYQNIIDMTEEDLDQAQEEMWELAEKYTDGELADLWEVSRHKIGELRRQLGIFKDSGGNIVSIEDPTPPESTKVTDKRSKTKNQNVSRKTKQNIAVNQDKIIFNNISPNELKTIIAMTNQLTDHPEEIRFNVEITKIEGEREKAV